jgi:hypothetical protein
MVIEVRYRFGWRGYSPVVEGILETVLERAVADGLSRACVEDIASAAMRQWVQDATTQEGSLEA